MRPLGSTRQPRSRRHGHWPLATRSRCRAAHPARRTIPHSASDSVPRYGRPLHHVRGRQCGHGRQRRDCRRLGCRRHDRHRADLNADWTPARASNLPRAPSPSPVAGLPRAADLGQVPNTPAAGSLRAREQAGLLAARNRAAMGRGRNRGEIRAAGNRALRFRAARARPAGHHRIGHQAADVHQAADLRPPADHRTEQHREVRRQGCH